VTGLPWATRATKTTEPDPVTPEVRATVRERSGGACELGCGQRATHIHHRQLRRYGDHQAANLLHVDALCHRRIHDRVRYSLDVGWLVASHDDPRTCAVLFPTGPVLLYDDGTTEATA
jgi:hypothetical protein